MKRLQNSLYINTQGAYLHKERETLVVDIAKEKVLQLPIHSISGIFCFGNVMVSPQVMGFCGERGVNLAFFTEYGRFLARVQGRQTGNVLLRRSQYKYADTRATEIARTLVAAKIQSQRQILQRHQRNYGKQDDVNQTIALLKSTVERLKIAKDLDIIRGLEGDAAARYFSVFNHLITEKSGDFNFIQRTRRPPTDPVNALLSFFYAIVGNDISAALQGVGLDPQVGFLHRDRPGRDSLAQDILEEFRAYIVDRLVLTLINRQQIKAADFIYEASGAVKLKDTARKVVLQEFQARKQKTIIHPYLKEEIPLGLLPHAQALLLARHLRGDLEYYPPFLAR
ncbi:MULTISPECIES: type I-C CRISPR-associated endonuclease Cas1c [Nitrincola]|uniref:CRISPR-associated endonuclease Cas1 n=1 Tax=Nitrincola tibetensis TaxID=2219697 RepID=A0A364NS21_9GAMM|nr:MULTISPECIES: type I-C CRISPR-associated endonuclease Cas1c [Nitrincola]RAU19893.1 subtype I-C CRISPR-associated endonuclease Cas1 [Nitrincola tibetensis]